MILLATIILPIQLTAMHWLLAYGSAFIYVLLKINELNQDQNYMVGSYIKKYWASTLATAIMIPISLIVLADNFPDILPINNITACLCGWQTNSMFRTLMNLGKRKNNLEDKDDDSITKQPQ